MEITHRPIGGDEARAALRMASLAWGEHFHESHLAAAQAWRALGSALGAFEGSDIVGSVALYPLEMTIPGGTATTACIGDVVVLPTHTRRGIMTSLITRQLSAAREQGLALAALSASESTIYGRFGFGMAVEHHHYSIKRWKTGFRNGPQWDGQTRIIDKEEARETLPRVYWKSAPQRAGVLRKPTPQWDDVFDDIWGERARGGEPASFFVVYQEGDDVEGYAEYRIKDGKVSVRELVACNDQAAAALWRRCFDLDLTKTITATGRPIDDPLIWTLQDPRALKRRPYDTTWLRLVSVPEALALRRYAREDAIVFRVRDDVLPWNQGVFELRSGPLGADCAPSRKPPDLSLSVDDLAVPYLGGSPFTPLARAGRVEELTRGALERADAMFATQHKPWSPMMT